MHRELNNSGRATAVQALCATVVLIVVLGGWFGTFEACAASNDFEVAMEAAQAGDRERAVELWTKVIRRNPRSYAALVNRGSAFRHMGYVFRAILDWHEARKWSPLFAFGVYSGDYIAQASGDTSLLNFASPLELDPDHVASVLMAGILFTEIGRPAMAEELYRKSVDLTRNPMLKTYLDHLADRVSSSEKE